MFPYDSKRKQGKTVQGMTGKREGNIFSKILREYFFLGEAVQADVVFYCIGTAAVVDYSAFTPENLKICLICSQSDRCMFMLRTGKLSEDY